jgi:ribosomal protein S18 acetylase RimI-like enzyme
MNHEPVHIRKMRNEDLDDAMAVLSRWNMAPRSPGPDNPSPERSGIQVENSFVAVAGQRVVGVASYIVYTPDSAETASLAVDPAFRGRGIGRRL